MNNERAPLSRDPGRESPAPGVKISLDGPNIVFLTVCAKDRRPWMAQRIVHESLHEIWTKADAWLVGYYLLMPDHLHLFCAPRDLRFTIEQWMTYWKREFSRAHLDQHWEWQRKGAHHRLRHAREFSEKWQYVRENPLRQGLVKHLDEWPFSGTIHELRWG